MEENTAQPIQANQTTAEVQTPAVPVAHAETKTGWMPRKTFFLILLLTLVTIVLLAIALLPNLKSPLVTKPTTTTPALAYAKTNLSLSTPLTATPSGYKTDVQISTGKNEATAVQLEIVYDPKILTNVDIQPGSFFTDPTILLKQIDSVKGKITYVLGIGLGQKAVTGNGTVATITFSQISGQTKIKTPINFGAKTVVTAVGYPQSVLLKSTGVLFSIAPTPTP